MFLIAYIVPLVFGLSLMTKIGDGLAETLSGLNPRASFSRGRHMMGMNFAALTGFVVSVHTTWITFKISEGGNVCSSATVFSCDDVLGNEAKLGVEKRTRTGPAEHPEENYKILRWP